jgi:hypothetical protein
MDKPENKTDKDEQIKEIIIKNKEKIAIRLLLSILAPISMGFIIAGFGEFGIMIGRIVIIITCSIVAFDTITKMTKEKKIIEEEIFKKRMLQKYIPTIILLTLIGIAISTDFLTIIISEIFSFYLVQRLLWHEIDQKIEEIEKNIATA